MLVIDGHDFVLQDRLADIASTWKVLCVEHASNSRGRTTHLTATSAQVRGEDPCHAEQKTYMRALGKQSRMGNRPKLSAEGLSKLVVYVF